MTADQLAAIADAFGGLPTRTGYLLDGSGRTLGARNAAGDSVGAGEVAWRHAVPRLLRWTG